MLGSMRPCLYGRLASSFSSQRGRQWAGKRAHPNTHHHRLPDAVAIRPGLPYPAFQVRLGAGALYWYTDAAGASSLPEEVRVRAQQKQGGKL